MINIENQYRGLVAAILQSAPNKEDRTGVGTKSVFGRQLTHDMSIGFPLLTNKKMYFNSARTELLWILNGRTDMKYLQDNNVSYWDADYKRSGRTDGTLGPVYGHQWRKWKIADGAYTRYVDQLYNLVKNIKENPSSRRLLVSAWNAAELDSMALPPCHYAFQVYINNGKMDLMWVQRSADVFLGLPYDIAMYGLLLELLCKETEYIPGKLIAQLGDCHIYNNHIDAATCYMYRKETNDLPELKLNDGIKIIDDKLHIPSKESIKILNYNPLPAIPAKLNVGK
jgi:thymidylate synthase